jgi:D-alanyl-D-alanine carboxypeptidase
VGKDISEMASYLQPLYLQFKADCAAAGLPGTTEDIGRTPAEQQADLAAGRSWTAESKHLPQPPEWKSEAFDEVPKALVVLKFWGWYGTIESSNPLWLKMGEIGEKLGLEWGGRWPVRVAPLPPPHSRPDPGHFQWKPPAAAELNMQGDA